MRLERKAVELRLEILDLICSAGTGHIGGDFSAIDILTYLYYEGMNISPATVDNPDRDRFILSKGHAVEALYSVLADRGFFDRQALHETYSQLGSPFIGHPNNQLPGIEMNSGSLGHGLPAAVGIALAGQMDHRRYYTYVLTGDGELAEGSVWEAFMAAPHFGLDHLVAIIDRNGLQISGSTEDVMPQGDLAGKLKLFGWDVQEIDGNSIPAIRAAVQRAKQTGGRPTAIIANTVKGCGVSFMQNRAGWHHRVPTAEEAALARDELMQKARELDERSGE